MMPTIRLIEPTMGSVTIPLQECTWPPQEETGKHESPVVTPLRWDELWETHEDRSLPRALCFSWEVGGSDADDFDFEFLLSRDDDFADARCLQGIREPSVELAHLFIGTKYYWQVRATQGGKPVAASPVHHFTTNPTPPRWIRVPGITNVRDVGGWPLARNRVIRQGMVYRSSELNNHLQITAEGKDVLTEELGIRTDLDLRGDHEVAAPVLDSAQVQWLQVPIWPYSFMIVDVYMERYRQVFEIFADPSNYPILFHCWGGADRAGTVAFLLNALLGADFESLALDYELTSCSIWGDRVRSSPEFMSMMRALNQFGDKDDSVNAKVEKYLLAIGVTDAQITTIRDIMIDHHVEHWA